MASDSQFIEELIAQSNSDFVNPELIQFIGNDKDLFKILMDFVFDDDWLINQRASWVVYPVIKKYPQLLNPYIQKIIDHLDKANHDSYVRNTMRLFQEIEIPEINHAKLYDYCINLISDIKQAVAIKVFAMTVCYRIAAPYPELLKELKMIIETQLPHEKPGFKSRGRKTLVLIEKDLKRDVF